MVLKNDLYNIIGRSEADGTVSFKVGFNPSCFIYKAHFPGNPITPGVCIVQTAKELLEEMTGRQLEIAEAKDVKFLNILSPSANDAVDFVFSDVTDDSSSVKAKVEVRTGDEMFTTVNFVCSVK